MQGDAAEKLTERLGRIEGIEAMEREETAYWLGMAMHRKNPRRVLMALRFLLTEPKVRKANS